MNDEPHELDDIQAAPDARGVPLQRVGVRSLRYPVRFADIDDGAGTATTGVFAVYASLDASVRGQHLSRFVAWVRDWAGRLSISAAPAMLDELAHRLNGSATPRPTAGFRVDFPWFLDRAAPAGGERAQVAYDGHFAGEWPAAAKAPRCWLGARVPVTSLCPCSKAVSDFGAHNQRGHIDIRLELAVRPRAGEGGGFAVAAVGLAEIIARTEAAGSSPVYSLLKRVDERVVTMRAYEHPAFVEDLARAAVLPWRDDERVVSGRAAAQTQESIHAHDAFAEAAWARGE